MGHIVIIRPDQHKHLGVAWQHVVEHVARRAANGQGDHSADDAKTAREVGKVTAAVEQWGEAMAFTLRPLRNLSGSGRDQEEGHHG